MNLMLFDCDAFMIHHCQFKKTNEKHLKGCVMKTSVCPNPIEVDSINLMPGDQLISINHLGNTPPKN